MQLQMNAISAYLRGPKRQDRTVKKRGRPRKETPEHYAAVLRGHAQIAQWFREERGCPHRSDVELYEAFRQHVFASREYQRPEEAEMADDLLAVRLKTALNVLGRARRYFRESPEKPPLTGMDHAAHTSFNDGQEFGDIE